MKFCCASNAAIKNVKIARKNNQFFPKKYRFLEKNNYYFWIIEVLSSFRLLIYVFRCNHKAMNELCPAQC